MNIDIDSDTDSDNFNHSRSIMHKRIGNDDIYWSNGTCTATEIGQITKKRLKVKNIPWETYFLEEKTAKMLDIEKYPNKQVKINIFK